MNKFVKLTNNIGHHKGNPIHINTEWIAAVYEENTEMGVKTFVYGGPVGVCWDVEETVSEVLKKIEKVENESSSDQ